MYIGVVLAIGAELLHAKFNKDRENLDWKPCHFLSLNAHLVLTAGAIAYKSGLLVFLFSLFAAYDIFIIVVYAYRDHLRKDIEFWKKYGPEIAQRLDRERAEALARKEKEDDKK